MRMLDCTTLFQALGVNGSLLDNVMLATTTANLDMSNAIFIKIERR